MLNVYKVMSENISSAIATNGESVTKQPLIRSMRTVKKETLKLISTWVSRSNDMVMVSYPSTAARTAHPSTESLTVDKWKVKGYELTFTWSFDIHVRS